MSIFFLFFDLETQNFKVRSITETVLDLSVPYHALIKK